MKKNVYGVTGYPTPDFTTERICRSFSIPNSTLALGAFMGAVWELASEEAWQAYGDMTPAEAAAMMQNLLWDVMTGEDIACMSVPIPYWDTAADVDDQSGGDAQIWYGQIVETPTLMSGDELTFLDNVGIWAIAGFIAYAGLPGAAIAFVPLARRFVLAFKQHDAGGVVRVLFDFAEVAEIDTYGVEDKILMLDIFQPDDDDPHTLYVEMSDENPHDLAHPQIQVIRKRLDASEVSPTNIRYNPDTDAVEQTYDGGVMWVPNPAADPRSAAGFLRPPIASDDPRCQAAANMTDRIQSIISGALSSISKGLDALGVVTAILPVFVELGPFAILIDIGIGLASALIGLGVDVINDEFTETTYEALTCIFFCDIESNGTVTADDLSQIQFDIATQMTADVQLIMGLIFSFMGFVGLSNAGTLGEAPADCDSCDCGWCWVWDGVNDPAWSFFPSDTYGGGQRGSFSGGEWVSSNGPTSSEILMSVAFPVPGELTRIQVTFSKVVGSFDGSQPDAIIFDSPNGFYDGTALTEALASTNDGPTWGWDGEQTINTNLSLWMFAASQSSGITYGTVTITKIQMWGTGDNPFGDNNC